MFWLTIIENRKYFSYQSRRNSIASPRVVSVCSSDDIGEIGKPKTENIVDQKLLKIEFKLTSKAVPVSQCFLSKNNKIIDYSLDHLNCYNFRGTVHRIPHLPRDKLI